MKPIPDRTQISTNPSRIRGDKGHISIAVALTWGNQVIKLSATFTIDIPITIHVEIWGSPCQLSVNVAIVCLHPFPLPQNTSVDLSGLQKKPLQLGLTQLISISQSAIGYLAREMDMALLVRGTPVGISLWSQDNHYSVVDIYWDILHWSEKVNGFVRALDVLVKGMSLPSCHDAATWSGSVLCGIPAAQRLQWRWIRIEQ